MLYFFPKEKYNPGRIVDCHIFYSIFLFHCHSSFCYGQNSQNPAWLHQTSTPASQLVVYLFDYSLYLLSFLRATVIAGFFNNDTLKIFEWEFFYVGGCQMFSSMPGLYSVDASSTLYKPPPSTSPQFVTKWIRIFQMFNREHNSFWVMDHWAIVLSNILLNG